MQLLSEIVNWADRDTTRRKSAADYCRALALEHCATGELVSALAWSKAARAMDTITARMQSAAAPTVLELEREYCDRKGVSVYCKECRSYHSTPRNFELWQALRCRRPWEEWTRKATPEEIAEFTVKKEVPYNPPNM